jgi:hypothetical protein
LDFQAQHQHLNKNDAVRVVCIEPKLNVWGELNNSNEMGINGIATQEAHTERAMQVNLCVD